MGERRSYLQLETDSALSGWQRELQDQRRDEGSPRPLAFVHQTRSAEDAATLLEQLVSDALWSGWTVEVLRNGADVAEWALSPWQLGAHRRLVLVASISELEDPIFAAVIEHALLSTRAGGALVVPFGGFGLYRRLNALAPRTADFHVVAAGRVFEGRSNRNSIERQAPWSETNP